MLNQTIKDMVRKHAILEVTALESVPVGCMNRDDTGAPKTAVYGGVKRLRISSQSWKKAMRDWMKENVDPSYLGIRTKYVAARIAEEMVSIDDGISYDEALSVACYMMETALGIKMESDKKKKRAGDEADAPNASSYLVFIPAAAVTALAGHACKSIDEGTVVLTDGKVDPKADGFDAKAFSKGCKGIFDMRKNADYAAFDVAMFGRMIADAQDMSVDACCAVAHAIGVGKCAVDFDYFTAVDEHEGLADNGAGMVGVNEFVSGVMHRYAVLDLGQLRDYLGDDEVVAQAVEAFLRAFVLSVPSGKRNSYATLPIPEAVMVRVGGGQAVNTVGAFERPVSPEHGESTVAAATAALVRHMTRLDGAYHILDGSEVACMSASDDADRILELGTPCPDFDELVERCVSASVASLR